MINSEFIKNYNISNQHIGLVKAIRHTLAFYAKVNIDYITADLSIDSYTKMMISQFDVIDFLYTLENNLTNSTSYTSVTIEGSHDISFLYPLTLSHFFSTNPKDCILKTLGDWAYWFIYVYVRYGMVLIVKDQKHIEIDGEEYLHKLSNI